MHNDKPLKEFLAANFSEITHTCDGTYVWEGRTGEGFKEGNNIVRGTEWNYITHKVAQELGIKARRIGLSLGNQFIGIADTWEEQVVNLMRIDRLIKGTLEEKGTGVDKGKELQANGAGERREKN